MNFRMETIVVWQEFPHATFASRRQEETPDGTAKMTSLPNIYYFFTFPIMRKPDEV